MAMLTTNLILLCLLPTSFAFDHSNWSHRMWRRSSSTTAPAKTVPPAGYYNPLDGGGNLLTIIPVTFPMGQGEPVNTIISGNSDARVLIDAEVKGGLRNYLLSLGFSGECLGQHSGSDQAVNLGDGNGAKNETGVIRWDYGDAQLGSCEETIQGGNHLRYWIQDGPSANSGAIFMATSYEEPIAQQHNIVPNGYNLGRDWLIGNITKSTVPTQTLTNGTVFSGTTSWANYTYQSDILYVSGMLANSSDSINHNITVGINGIPACDGLVAVIKVAITGEPPKSSASTTSPPPWHLTSFMVALFSLTMFPIFFS